MTNILLSAATQYPSLALPCSRGDCFGKRKMHAGTDPVLSLQLQAYNIISTQLNMATESHMENA